MYSFLWLKSCTQWNRAGKSNLIFWPTNKQYSHGLFPTWKNIHEFNPTEVDVYFVHLLYFSKPIIFFRVLCLNKKKTSWINSAFKMIFIKEFLFRLHPLRICFRLWCSKNFVKTASWRFPNLSKGKKIQKWCCNQFRISSYFSIQVDPVLAIAVQ